MTDAQPTPALPRRTRALIGSLIGSLVGFGAFALLTFGFGWASMYPMMLVGIGAGFGATRASGSSELAVATLGVVTGVLVAVGGLAILGRFAGLNPFFEEMTPEAAQALSESPLGVPSIHLLFASAVTAIAAVLSIVATRLLPHDDKS